MKILKLAILLFFAFTINSFGAIVHLTPNTTLDANSASPFVSYPIMGGTLELSHWSFMASGFQIDNFGANQSFGLANPTTVGPPGFLLTPLNLNDPISATQNYASGAPGTSYYSASSGSPSIIANNQSTYFGFRTVVGTNNYYGWIKITRQSSDIVIVDEYAYENTANTSINAGATGTAGPILVTSIAVSGQGSATTITTANGTLQMLANVLPANATNSTVTWSVQNGTGSATINATGLLTAQNNGTVTVTATANDGSNVTGTAAITISNQPVNIPVTSIAVTGQGNVSTITTNGGTLQMIETVLPANATNSTVTWSVQNGTGSANISATGLLAATSNGTVTVIATANDGSNVTGSTQITISNQTNILVTSITVAGQGNISTITTNGGTLQMIETVLPINATNSAVNWSVQNGTGSAVISNGGLLTAQSNGTVTVTASANDGSNISGNAQVTISNQGVTMVGAINVYGQNNINLINTPAGNLQMIADILPVNANNQNVNWFILSGSNFATLSATGLLSATANGLVDVVAIAQDGSNVTGMATIQITNQTPQVILVNAINVSGQGGASTITTMGGSLQMIADVLPLNATNSTVSWLISSGTGSAILSSGGLLTAVSDGTVTVTANANDGSGKSGSKVITISNQNALDISNFSNTQLEIFPNPVASYLNINGNTYNIVRFNLMDMFGKILNDYPLTSKDSRIDLSHLPTGVYMAVFSTETKQVQAVKIIKQ